MGGMSFILNVQMTAEGLQPRPGRRSLLDKLIGRHPTVSITRFDAGNGTHYEADATGLEGAVDDFVRWLSTKLDSPNAATQIFFDTYLGLRSPPVRFYIRGEGSSGPESAAWYLQMAFSGCAGMAEVSAELASHWAQLWYEAEPASIDQRLSALGVVPRGVPDFGNHEEGRFLPFSGVGYGVYRAGPIGEDEERFEFDASMTSEQMDEGEYETFLARASEHEAAMGDGRCHCQICDGGFAVIRVSTEAR